MVAFEQRNRSKYESAVVLISIASLLWIARWVSPRAFAVACLGSVSLLAIHYQAKRSSVPRLWPLLGFVTVLGVFVVDSQLHLLPSFPDAAYYDRLGWQTAQAWHGSSASGTVEIFNLRVKVYAYFVAAVYYVFGHYPVAVITIHAGLWGLTIGYWLGIARWILNTSRYWLAGPAFVAYPAATLYLSATLREAIAMFLVTITIVRLVSWFRSPDFADLLGAVVFSVPLGLIRPELVPPIWAGAGLAFLYVNRRIASVETIGAVTSALVMVLSVPTVLDIRVPRYLNPVYFLDVSTLETIRAAAAGRPHAYLVWMEYTSWFDVIVLLPLRAFYFLLSPFPWIPALFDLTIATVDSIFVTVVALVAVGQLLRNRIGLRRETVFLIGFAVFLIAGYSLVISTPSAARRRIFVVPVLIIVAGLVQRRIEVTW